MVRGEQGKMYCPCQGATCRQRGQRRKYYMPYQSYCVCGGSVRGTPPLFFWHSGTPPFFSLVHLSIQISWLNSSSIGDYNVFAAHSKGRHLQIQIAQSSARLTKGTRTSRRRHCLCCWDYSFGYHQGSGRTAEEYTIRQGNCWDRTPDHQDWRCKRSQIIQVASTSHS